MATRKAAPKPKTDPLVTLRKAVSNARQRAKAAAQAAHDAQVALDSALQASARAAQTLADAEASLRRAGG